LLSREGILLLGCLLQLPAAFLGHLPIVADPGFLLAAQIIVTMVRGDPPEPGAERGPEVVAPDSPERFNENLLRNVFDFIASSDQVEHQSANAPLVKLDQEREGFPFPALNTLDPFDLLGIPGRVFHPDSIGFALHQIWTERTR